MKKSTRKGFIYFRYALPCITAVIFAVLMFVPCYRFVTADTGINSAVSLWELMGNSWDTVREYMFGSGQKADVTLDFARTLMGVLITLWVLFAVGLGFAVYSAVSAFKYFSDGCRDSRARVLFVTLTANRVVLCIWYALMLPIFLLPRIMPFLYDGILAYHIELITEPFDILWIALAVFAATVAVVLISGKYEVLAELNIYTKRHNAEPETDDEETEEIEDNTPKSAYEIMSERAKAEQAERIWRLLNKDGDTTDGEDNK